MEEVRLQLSWDQALTLLWFEDEDAPRERHDARRSDAEQDVLLEELDGTLKWPGKRRRR